MATWVDLAALHNPAPGQRPPASWGDGVNSNLAMLGGTAMAEVTTAQGTASVTFVNLTTVGPTVNVDTGTKALVLVYASFTSSLANSGAALGVAVSGASTIAAGVGTEVLEIVSAATPIDKGITGIISFTTLTPGTNIFTLQYRAHWGGTATFSYRRIAVFALV